MLVRDAVRLYLDRTLWRATGLRWAGRALVRALGSPDEGVRALAGMFLVQAGRRSEPLLAEAVARRENLPVVLTILGDLGDPRFAPELRRFRDDPDPEVAQAAEQALRVLRAR
jgi:hypothetical protein